MTGPGPEPRSRELVPDEWRELDDTLADGPSPAEVPTVAKTWLAEQRLVHGLLRALCTADAGARESRIQSLLERIDSRRVTGGRRYWAVVGIAATLLASLALWFALPSRLPTAEAAVERIVSEMDRDVDRRFRVAFRNLKWGKEQASHVFWLVTRPGMRFRVDGKFTLRGQQVAELRIGCDGKELWALPVHGLWRRSVPLAERDKLLEAFGDVLDAGYLDVHALVRKLPAEFDVRVVGREQGGDGRDLLRIEATRRGGWFGLRSAWLLCDEESGMVHQLGLRSAAGFGVQRSLQLDYLGEEPAGLVDYGKPW